MVGFGLSGRIWVRMGPKGDKALRMGQGETDGRMDGWMDGQTDGQTDKASYRVACPQLKTKQGTMWIQKVSMAKARKNGMSTSKAREDDRMLTQHA